MSQVGFQQFQLLGARLYFKREDQGATKFPVVDLGLIQQVTPTISSEKIELEDPDGGVKRKVDESVTEITEAYDLQTANMSLENMALLYLGNPPESFTQSAAEKDVVTHVHPGALVKVHDSDTAKTKLYNLSTIGGIYTGVIEAKVIESITKATKIIKLTGDQTAEAGLAAGKAIIVRRTGLANILNSRTYTVVSATLNTGKTDVVVAEEPAADDPGITGSLYIEDGGTIYKQDVDWKVGSLQRGFAQIVTGGAIVAEGDPHIVFSLTALSGKRLIKPQALQGEIKGDAMLVLSSGGNAIQAVRECRVSLTPNSASFSADDFSNMTLTMTVLSDTTDVTQPAGRLLQFVGSLPASS